MTTNIIEASFPALASSGYRLTSPFDPIYNCIAWAGSDNQRFWWPDKNNIGYWPNGVPREETVDAFVQAYATLGYAIIENGGLEPRREKIALYGVAGKPKHAARQVGNGFWTSKLGENVDIEHTLSGLVGDIYGEIILFLARSKD